MSPRKLVLFDIDGTLLRASGSGKAATERAMREVFGTVGRLAEYRFSGKTDWFTLLHLLTPEGFTEAEVEAALVDYDLALARHMTDIMKDYHIHALPGTHELVRALQAHPDVVIGILTGNMPQVAALKLRAAGFDPEDFAVAVYGSEAPVRRQLAPLAIDRAEQHCGLRFTPSDVIIIGDTPDDIDCAHSIGAKAIAVATGTQSRAELEQHPPVTVLDDLADTRAVLALILDDAHQNLRI
jgi:phosphoglycolate phosphatase-like HAD superfamily hydrolase